MPQIIFILGILIYRFFLDNVYIQTIAPFYAYQGLDYVGTNIDYWISWGVLIAFSLLMSLLLKYKEFFLSNILILLFLIRFVPFTSLLACKSLDNRLLLMELIYWGAIFLFSLILKRPCLHFSFPKRYKLSTLRFSVVDIVLVFSVLIVLFVSGCYAHFRLNFSLMNVYDLREEARDFSMPVLLKYLWSATGNVLPVLFVYYLIIKRRIACCFIAFVILLNFSVDGLKANIFKLFLCLLLHLVYKQNLIKMFPWLFALLCFFSLAEYYVFSTPLLSEFVVRRVLYIPALLDSYYFDYISKYGPVFYQRGDVHIDFIIGEEYFGKASMRANNGLFTDAYMNLGEIGCLVYPFVYVAFFKFCESSFEGVNVELVMFVIIIMVITLNSSEFTTSLLTHGLFALCLLLYFLPRKRYD